MEFAREMIRQAPLAAVYLAAASATIALTRFDGGVACLWIASAILIAALVQMPRRLWTAPLVACGAVGFLATSLWGLGLKSAGPFVVINLTEAVIVALLLKRRMAGVRALTSLDWFWRFVLAAGLIAPLVSGIMAASWLWLAGIHADAIIVFGQFFIGHSLGNLTLTPLAMLVNSRKARRKTRAALTRRPGETLAMMALVIAVVLGVFSQTFLPLLFLPILPIVLLCFRVGREAAALAIALLAIIGGVLTTLGMGPISLLDQSPLFRVVFFQFYLAMTVLTLLPITSDLTNRKLLNRQLRASQESYRILAEFSTDVIFKLDLDGRIRFVTPSICQLGYRPEELVGRNCSFLIHPDDFCQAVEAHQQTLRMDGATNRFEYRAIAADGSYHWFESHARVVVDENGEVDGMVSIVRNIGDRKANEHRLTLAALTDVLTGLPNRRAFREQVERLRQAEGIENSVALLDLDHFKMINDDFGHSAGDDVLKAFANIAKRFVRNGDLVARVGGEEFAILFPATSPDNAYQICERIRAELAGAYIMVGGHSIKVTVSGGVAQIGPDGLERAMKIADEALYRAKERGRDRLALAA